MSQDLQLTMSELHVLAQDAQIAFCLDKFSSYDVALARKVEAAAHQKALNAAIDMVAFHGGSVELEASIRALGGKDA